MNALTFQSLTENPLINFFGFFLVHSLWQATIIAAAAAILLISLRRASANLRYVVACIALVAMIGVPLLTGTYCARMGTEPRTVVAAGGLPIIAIESRPGQHALATPSMSSLGELGSIQSVTQPPTVSKRTWSDDVSRVQNQFTISITALANALRQWFPLIVALWAVGIAFLATRLIAGLRLVRILRASGHPASDKRCQVSLNRLVKTMGIRPLVRLVESHLATVPAVIGWLRPMILVPASMTSGLSVSELEALLAHELAHIRRHDYLVNVVQSLAETVLFFHPAVWWLSRAIRIERENCCDDIAIEVCGNRVAFARALARMEQLRSDQSVLVLAASGGSLVRRIRRVVGRDVVRSGSWMATSATVLVLLLGFVAAAGIGIVGTGILPANAEASQRIERSGELINGLDRNSVQDPTVVPNLSSANFQTHQPEILKTDSKTGVAKHVLAGVRLQSIHESKPRAETLDMMYSNVMQYTFIPARVAKTLGAEKLGAIDFGQTPPSKKTVDAVQVALLLPQLSFDPQIADKPATSDAVPQLLVAPSVFVNDDIADRRDIAFSPYANDPIFVPDHLAFYNVNKTGQHRFTVVRIDRVQLGLGPEFGPVNALVLDDSNSEFGVLGSDWAQELKGPKGEGFIWSANDGFYFAALEADGRMKRSDPAATELPPSADEGASDDDEAPPPITIMSKDDDRVTKCRILSQAGGRSPAELLEHFSLMGPQGLPIAEGSIVNQETIVSAQPRYLLPVGQNYGMDADEVNFSLPEGAGMQAIFSGSSIEIESDKSRTVLTLTDGRVDLIDAVGVTRASASADGGANQMIVECITANREAAMVIRTNKKDCPVQVRLIVETGAPADEKDPPHGAIRYAVLPKEGTDSEPARMKMQWHYDMKQLAEEAEEADPTKPSPRKTDEGRQPEQSKDAALISDGTALVERNQREPADADEWGPKPEQGDLRARLTLQGENPKAGQPLRLRLELKNFGEKVETLDPQYYFPFRVLRVTRVDGTPDWFIGPTPQTAGKGELMVPGNQLTLWEDVDATELFMLDAGGYTIEATPNQAQLPRSNVLHIKVLPGEMPPFKQFLLGLQKTIPKEWRLSSGHGAVFLMHSSTGLKKDVTSIQIWFTPEKLPADFRFGETAPPQEIHYLGEHSLGHANVAAPERAGELWPSYLDDVRIALSPEPKNPRQDKNATEDPSDRDTRTSIELRPQSESIARETPWSAVGRVTDGEGRPIAGATVRAHCGMGTLHETGAATTDGDGRYKLDFGPGIFSQDKTFVQAATISVNLDGHFEKNMHRQGDLLAANKLPEGEIGWGGKKPEDVFLPDKPKTIDFVMLPAAHFRGTVLDQDGKKLAGIRISLTGDELPPSSSVVAQTRTDDEGRFTIDNVPTGFKFQILVEPAKAESPWLAWASPPVEFVADDSNDAHLRYSDSGKAIDFSVQRLTLLLHGTGVNWKTSLEESKSKPLAPKYDGLSTGEGTIVSAGMAWIELGK